MRRWCGIAAVALVAAFARADGARIEREPAFVKRVGQAIDLGCDWLRKAQARDGTWPAYPSNACATTAFAFHTLRACGTPADEPALVNASHALEREWKAAGAAELQTYAVALTMMAVAERGQRLPQPDGERTTKLVSSDEAWMKSMVTLLERRQDADGTWSYLGGSEGRNRTDNSNTQYALLGLKAAARCGVAIKPAVWRASLTHFVNSQDADGAAVPVPIAAGKSEKRGDTRAKSEDRARGWGYTERGASYGSMTAGGVGSVVICRSELLGTPAMTANLDQRAERSIRDGIAWLGVNYSVRTNPGPKASMAGPAWHYYWLYGVERAGVLAGVEWFGERDWYGEGADYLCDEQQVDGSWSMSGGILGMGVRTPHDSVVHTCFALLFLKKGTLPVRRGALTQGSQDEDIRFEGAAELPQRDLEDLLDLVLARWRRSPDADVRTRLFDRATAIGPRIVAPLLVRMSSEEEADRVAAHTLLRRATAEDFGFDPKAARDKREDAVLGWQGWWLISEKTLRYDAALGRLR